MYGLMRDATKNVQSTWQVSSSRWVLPKYKLRTSSPDEAAPLQVVLSSFALWHYESFTDVLKEQNGLILKIKTLSSLNRCLSRPGVVRDVLQTRRISTQTANHFLLGGHVHFSYWIIPDHMLFKVQTGFLLELSRFTIQSKKNGWY